MATVEFVCPDCGEVGEKRIGEQPLGRTAWFGSFTCARCGAAYEEDGWGDLPPAWRSAVLAQEGEWELRVTPVEIGAVLKVLRAALGLTLAEAGRLKTSLPGAPCAGTRAEMERLRSLLLVVGERAEVARRG